MGTPIAGKGHRAATGPDKVPLSPDGFTTAQEIAALGSGFDFTGNGSPEGVQTANVGQNYYDSTNGAIYYKASGTATNTGWVGGPVSAFSGGFPIAGVPGLYVTDDGSGEIKSVWILCGHATNAAVVITDLDASDPDTGTGNGLYWATNAGDGQQDLTLFLGSSGQYGWHWYSDGSTVLPGDLSFASNAVGAVLIDQVDGHTYRIVCTNGALQTELVT